MLSTTLLAFSGTTGMIIGAAISAFAFIFGALFGKRYRPPPPSEKYSEIQPYITKQVSEYVSDLQKEQLNNKLGLTGFIMQEYFEEYEDAIVHSKIEIRMSALDNIIRVLRALSEHETFAMAPSTFENAENFLLMKAGTNKCFGPPAGTEGKPTCMSRASRRNVSCL